MGLYGDLSAFYDGSAGVVTGIWKGFVREYKNGLELRAREGKIKVSSFCSPYVIIVKYEPNQSPILIDKAAILHL